MKGIATKAVYAAVGAPMVATRRLGEFSERMVEGARKEYEAWAKEGEMVGKKIRSSDMVEELSSRIDLDQIQGRVDKVRDELEDVLANWRDSFRPETGKPVSKPASAPKATKPAPAKKPAAKKTTVKATAAKKPAAKKTTVKATAAKKPAAKKTAGASK